MKPTKDQVDAIIDRATEEIRAEGMDPQTASDAADRVWARLSDTSAEPATLPAQADHIRNCDDFQSLIPAYLNGSLTPARTLLFEDHTHECITCRKALKLARSGGAAITPAFTQKAASPFRRAAVRYAIAATIILAIGLVSVGLVRFFGGSGSSLLPSVYATNGQLYVVSENGTRPINEGDTFNLGDRIRSDKDTEAVIKMADGSLVEMNGRSELYITDTSEGATVHLERGDVIVEAAKQHSRHLYVSTRDCLVSVTGTIFSVDNGTKGSRVAVLEGEVHVDHNGETHVLHPGDQIATNPSLDQVSIGDEFAWSRNAKEYAGLVSEIASARKDLNERVSMPAVRFSTRLLDLTPAGTVVYAAIPNVSSSLKEASRIIDERMQQNPALREWWEKTHNQSGKENLNLVIARVCEFGGYLGDEVTVSIGLDPQAEPGRILVLSEVKDPAAFRSYLEQQIASAGKGTDFRFIDNPATAAPSTHHEVLIWIDGGLFAASTSLDSLQQVSQSVKAPEANPFVRSEFYASLSGLYREGAGAIVAGDLETIIGRSLRKAPATPEAARNAEALSRLGVLDFKHAVMEMKDYKGRSETRAVLTFKEPLRGISSWLAAPGPMGSLEFISPDANIASAFVVKDPKAMVDDLLAALNSVNPDAQNGLAAFESQTRINIRNDIAATLGGEFAFAVDGPVLPVPSWKLILEVNDPAHLQNTIERMVEQINGYARMFGKPGLEWEKVESGGLTFYTLNVPGSASAMSYTFVSGYMVAAQSRALVDRAVKYRESGYTLLHSPRFIEALPGDGKANFSALFYQNLAPIVAPIAQQMGNGKDGKAQALAALASTAPTIAYAYAEGNRITFSMNGNDFGLNPASLLGMPGSFGLQTILQHGVKK